MRALLFVLLLATSGEATAQATLPASSMVPGCQEFLETKATYNAGRCAGIGMTLMYMGPGLVPQAKHCAPDAATVSQIVRVVLSFIEAQPQLGQQEFMLVALGALRKEWPC
jgi:hypothetical protein